MSASSVVLLASWDFDGWDLPPFVPLEDRVWMSGGHRTLLELAAAAAVSGYAVELRGVFIEREVESIEAVAGVELGRPRQPRVRTAADVVIVPEGIADPLVFAREVLSPARAVVAVLGAPGLFGWSFGDDPPPGDVLTVDTQAVGQPAQLESAHRLGLEVWTNLVAISEQASAIGLPYHYVGVGHPDQYPEPPAKRADVAILADNRWAPLARAALARLRPGVSRVELPRMPRQQSLQRSISCSMIRGGLRRSPRRAGATLARGRAGSRSSDGWLRRWPSPTARSLRHGPVGRRSERTCAPGRRGSVHRATPSRPTVTHWPASSRRCGRSKSS